MENNNNNNIGSMFSSMFNGLFSKIAPGCCRLSYTGNIAVKTSDGKYKAWNQKKSRLVNCTNFCLPNVSNDMFFTLPTCKVRVGDIIIVNDKPRCVVKVGSGDNVITAVNYENSTLENILPERHVFMGRTYFYNKVVSFFGGMMKSCKGPSAMMKMAMMSQMFGGMANMDNGANPMMNPMMLMMLGGGGMNNMFDSFDLDEGFNGIFGDASEDDEDDDDSDESEDVVDASDTVQLVEIEEAPKKSSKKKVTK